MLQQDLANRPTSRKTAPSKDVNMLISVPSIGVFGPTHIFHREVVKLTCDGKYLCHGHLVKLTISATNRSSSCRYTALRLRHHERPASQKTFAVTRHRWMAPHNFSLDGCLSIYATLFMSLDWAAIDLLLRPEFSKAATLCRPSHHALLWLGTTPSSSL